MSLRYEIKDFIDVDSTKKVGLIVTDEKNRVYIVDKYIDLVNGKTDEQYVQEAIAESQDQINNWQASFAHVGRIFNPETGTFE